MNEEPENVMIIEIGNKRLESVRYWFRGKPNYYSQMITLKDSDELRRAMFEFDSSKIILQFYNIYVNGQMLQKTYFLLLEHGNILKASEANEVPIPPCPKCEAKSLLISKETVTCHNCTYKAKIIIVPVGHDTKGD